MKKLILAIILIFSLSILSAQEESSYTMVMVKLKKSFKMAHSVKDFQDLANNFERVAESESDQWHPLYYAALSYINMSFVSENNDDKDSYLDKAQTFIDKAMAIYPDESELFVLQALLHQGRIQIDPAGRGMQYSMKATEDLKKAEQYNPDNPRTYYLFGMNILHTPEAFGGGAKAACPFFEKGVEKFKSYMPDNVLAPTWGGERNQQMFDKYCKDTGE